MNDEIVIKGAKEHNLKNINLSIPKNQLVIITGLSGSGKSSLAFDTIHAEGQRRYVESLSSYARQFLEQLQKPDVEHIEGLSPSIAIEQRTAGGSPRSIVATQTEVYDYLRLLFARIGKAHCYKCQRPISQQTAEEIINRIMGLTTSSKIFILSPVVRGKKGSRLRRHEISYTVYSGHGSASLTTLSASKGSDEHLEHSEVIRRFGSPLREKAAVRPPHNIKVGFC